MPTASLFTHVLMVETNDMNLLQEKVWRTHSTPASRTATKFTNQKQEEKEREIKNDQKQQHEPNEQRKQLTWSVQSAQKTLLLLSHHQTISFAPSLIDR